MGTNILIWHVKWKDGPVNLIGLKIKSQFFFVRSLFETSFDLICLTLCCSNLAPYLTWKLYLMSADRRWVFNYFWVKWIIWDTSLWAFKKKKIFMKTFNVWDWTPSRQLNLHNFLLKNLYSWQLKQSWL